MASRNEAKVQEGRKHLAAGDKCLQTGFFKWKPDHEGAAQAFKDAANCFKVARAHEDAKLAFVKAAKALESCGSDFHAAKYFEQAAMMAKELKQGEEAANLFEQAGLLFRANGSVDTAGIMLDRAGKILEPLNGGKALEMYLSAADLSEDAEKLRQATESLAKAVQLMVKYRKFDDCVKAMEHQLVLNEKLSNHQIMHKIALSIVLVHLCRDDYVAGERFFRDACGIDGFGDSDAGALAEDLLQAYDDGDTEAIERITSDQYFSFISTEIARLARALRGPQDLAPPDPSLAPPQGAQLKTYSRASKPGSDEAVRAAVSSKATPARAAEDRAALFGEAPPPAVPASSSSNTRSTAASSTSRESSRPADHPPPKASPAAARMPPADERAALFSDPADSGKGGSDPSRDRSDLFGSNSGAQQREDTATTSDEPVSSSAVDVPPVDETTKEEEAGEEKLFDDDEFAEGDLC
ncbi:gamma-soluble NSF attachment protein-like [Sycon ciliatum]|uniref:gamma-soluble NSF attachment protein-like n=1 Tax=Sycon ciliatum TaxID=27933 RepID=UPI0031F656A5